jgi:menaquinone-dependent protoporphyrinogen oxidase
MHVLIAYASRYGSTREIAAAVASRLRAAGHAVDVRDAGEIADIAAYDAVVLGSAVYDQEWLPEASALLRRNLGALADGPVWLFSVGSVSSARRWPLGPLAKREPKQMLGWLAAIHPRDYHVFAGVIEPGRFSFIGRLIVKVLYGHYGDLRNWQEIDAWADSIAEELVDNPVAPWSRRSSGNAASHRTR